MTPVCRQDAQPSCVYPTTISEKSSTTRLHDVAASARYDLHAIKKGEDKLQRARFPTSHTEGLGSSIMANFVKRKPSLLGGESVLLFVGTTPLFT